MNKKITVLIFLIMGFLISLLEAGFVATEDGAVEMYYATEVGGSGHTGSCMELDFVFLNGSCSKQTAEEVEVDTSLFPIETSADKKDFSIIRFNNPEKKYFVSVYPEQKVKFEVLYCDEFRDDVHISTGYPKVIYADTADSSAGDIPLTLLKTIPLIKETEQDNGWVFSKEADIVPGIYQYQYVASNEFYPGEYKLEISSFVVTTRPQGFKNLGLQDNTIVSNAKVNLKWEVPLQQGSTYIYKLYLWEENGIKEKVYEGADNFCEVIDLKYGTKYYWEVRTENQYGIASISSVYTFITISAFSKVFNYPNPFNPVKETTNIVFHSDSAQTAHIKIYSEYGDLIYNTSFNAMPGANEFTYNGRDDQGKVLYNGSYICRVKTDKGESTCYLLIIK